MSSKTNEILREHSRLLRNVSKTLCCAVTSAQNAGGGGGGGCLTADFSADSTSFNFWETVTFTDATSGTPTEWLWDFGDGTFSTLQNPTHLYPAVGTYSVTLKASDTLGGGGSVTKSSYITVGGDSDASAFIVATEITDATIGQAINTLVVALKAASVWTKQYAIYPFVGGTEFTHRFNLKNPLDTDAAYRLNFFLGWSHSATGALSNATQTLCSTHMILNTLTNWVTDNSMVAWNRSSTLGISASAGVLMGVGDTGTGAQRFCLSALRSNGIPFYDSGLSARVTGSVLADAKGFWGGVCRANNDRELYRNGVSIGTSSVTNTETAAAYPVYIGGLCDLTGFSSVSQIQQERLPCEFAFAGIGKALSDTEMSDYYTAVLAFQTTLSRN